MVPLDAVPAEAALSPGVDLIVQLPGGDVRVITELLSHLLDDSSRGLTVVRVVRAAVPPSAVACADAVLPHYCRVRVLFQEPYRRRRGGRPEDHGNFLRGKAVNHLVQPPELIFPRLRLHLKPRELPYADTADSGLLHPLYILRNLLLRPVLRIICCAKERLLKHSDTSIM